MSAVEAAGIAPIPLRRCAPWCDNPSGMDGHPDEHPDDRSCWSGSEKVSLSLQPPIEMAGGEWSHDYLDLVLRRRPDADDPAVVINYEGEPSWEFELTLNEARTMRDALDKLLWTADSRRRVVDTTPVKDLTPRSDNTLSDPPNRNRGSA